MSFDWKEFLRPTLAKIIVFAALFIAIGIFNLGIQTNPAEFPPDRAISPVGYEVTYKFFGPQFAPTMFEKCVKQTGTPEACTLTLDWLNIIKNSFIWYFVACVLIYTYERLVKK